MKDVNKKIQELYWPIAVELDKQGLKTTFEKDDLDKIKKILSKT